MYGHDVDPDRQPDDAHAPPAGPADGLERQLAEHGLISIAALMEHYGITTAGGVRKLMSDYGIGMLHGYPRDRALGIQRPGRHPKPGPGRGHRKMPVDPPDGGMRS